MHRMLKSTFRFLGTFLGYFGTIIENYSCNFVKTVSKIINIYPNVQAK